MNNQKESQSSVGVKRGAEVMAFRRKFKMSQEDLAELLGLTVDAIKKWETNQRGLSEPLWRLLQMFDNKPELMKEF